jgi:2-polyprenyl-3-methyl-5-hydroxy-6-metoxy-1,4-benzoquinol methylase
VHEVAPRALRSPVAGPATCTLCRTTFTSEAAELFVKDGHAIVRCPRCGLVFRARLPTRAELDEIYAQPYFGGAGASTREGYLDYVADAEVHRVNARRRLRGLAELVEPGRLLDVGCAAGFFVQEADRAGWQARGVDVSRPMVEWAQAHLHVDVRQGTLADLPADGEESCITMWDYLEHSLDPRADVAEAFTRLRPGGILALSTGDVGSPLARLSLPRWHLMTPRHHNFFFTRRTIGLLLGSVGFEIVAIGHPAAVFPVRYLAHKARLMLDVTLLDTLARRLAQSRLGARAIPMNLWDVMTVVARRPGLQV